MPDRIITTEQLQRIEHLFGQITTTLNALRQAETTPMPPPPTEWTPATTSGPLGEPIARYLDAVRRGLSDQDARAEFDAAVAETDDRVGIEDAPPINLTGADPASGAPLTDVFDQASVIVESNAASTAIGLERANARLRDYRRTASAILDDLRRFGAEQATAQAIGHLEALADRDREHAKFWTLPPAEPFCSCGATVTDPTHRAHAATATTEWHLVNGPDGRPYPDDVQALAQQMYQAGRADAGYFAADGNAPFCTCGASLADPVHRTNDGVFTVHLPTRS